MIYIFYCERKRKRKESNGIRWWWPEEEKSKEALDCYCPLVVQRSSLSLSLSPRTPTHPSISPFHSNPNLNLWSLLPLLSLSSPPFAVLHPSHISFSLRFSPPIFTRYFIFAPSSSSSSSSLLFSFLRCRVNHFLQILFPDSFNRFLTF